jgi:hypothetical protein
MTTHERYTAAGNYGESFQSSRIDYLPSIIAQAAFDPSGTWTVTDERGAAVAEIRSGAIRMIECPRCGTGCGDRDECDLALDGVAPEHYRNPLNGA